MLSFLTPSRHLSTWTLLFALCAAASSSGCQEIRDKRVALTQDQWRRVRGLILTERPSPKVEVGATFGLDGKPMIELVGYSLDANALITGKPFSITWHWHALADMNEDWKVFVHLVPQRGGAFQNLDHQPVEALFRTSAWEPNTFLVDSHQSTLKADFPSGSASLHVGWFSERNGRRLDIITPGKGQASAPNDPGRLFIGDLSARNDKFMILPKVSEPPTLDGLLNEPMWKQGGAGKSGRFVNAVTGDNVSTLAEAWGVYTDDSVYFAFDIKDNDLRATFTDRDDHLWEQDCVEIYLNPDNDDGTYWELQFSPGNTADNSTPIFDAYFEKRRQPHWERGKLANMPGLEAAIHRQGSLNDASGTKDTGYTLEVRIPFASLSDVSGAIDLIRLPDTPPKQGQTWRVNFFHVDLTGEPKTGNNPAFASWSASGGDFHNLDAFGTIEFGAPLPDKPPSPALAPKPPSITAFTASMGKRVLKLPDDFIRNRTGYFLPCLPNPVPDAASSQRLALNVVLNEDGKPRSIERQGPAIVDEAVTTCIVDKIQAWQIDLRPLDPAKVDPTKPDLAKVDPAKVDPTKPDLAKVDPTKPTPAKVDPTKPDPAKPDSTDADLSFNITIQYNPGRPVTPPNPPQETP